MSSNLLLAQVVQYSLQNNTKTAIYQSDYTVKVVCYDYCRFTFRITHNDRLDTFTITFQWYSPGNELIFTDALSTNDLNTTLFHEIPVRGYSVYIVVSTSDNTPPVSDPYPTFDFTAVFYKTG
jgi:hypothetical protein